MKHFLIIGILLSFIFLQSCKKEDNNLQDPDKRGAARAKGTANGVAASKNIDTTGGTITSGDGVFTVIIPPGALSNSSSIAIQPISSTLPMSLGAGAYRISPEGIHFLKPVTIQFKYSAEQISGSTPAVLFVAYQDTSGIWNADLGVHVDTIAKTIQVQSSHFSDWALFEAYKLRVSNTAIEFNGTAHLSVIGTYMYKGMNNEYVVGDTSLLIEAVKNWKLIGQGHLNAFGGHADYLAPGSVPSPNPVVVSVEVVNILSDLKNNGKEILFTSIYVNNEFMHINFKGNFYDATHSNANTSTITSIGPINVSIATASLNVGTYTFGNISSTSALLSISLKSEPAKPYGIFYFTGCPNPNSAQTAGSLIITKSGGIGDYVEGSFSGTLVNSVNCNNDFQTVNGSFRVKKI